MSSLLKRRGANVPNKPSKRSKRSQNITTTTTTTTTSNKKNSTILSPSYINVDKVKSTILNPTLWSCKQTGTTNDIWICLGDGHVVSKGSSRRGPATSRHHAARSDEHMR